MHFLKFIVKKCLSLTPYELKAKRTLRRLPLATFESVKLALAYYIEANRIPVFVQVGANDGVSGDPAYDFIKQGKMRAILVEPIEQSFKKLVRVYESVPNVTPVRAAIGKEDGEVILYRVKEGGKLAALDGASQIASFDKRHLLRLGIAEEEIEEAKAPCLTLRSLLYKNQLEHIDILQIDTEGFDAEIVKMALDLPIPPECINFENLHLDATALDDVFERLRDAGYLWTHDKWNTLALHERITKRWSC
jgi:FkbM family methyltransferase